MAIKTTNKEAVLEKMTPTETDAISPFGETVVETEASPSAKRAPRVFKVGKPMPAIEAAVEPTPAKRTRKPKTVTASDPFAEIAGTSPVKKPRRTTARAAEAAVTATKKKALAIDTASAAAPKKIRTLKPKKASAAKKKGEAVLGPEVAPTRSAAEVSPAFKALAEVKLPQLKKENRARLLLQSPTRAYFYWSLRQNPWQQLRAVFGEASSSFTLVVKLTNLTTGGEDLYPAEPEGERWFDVQPDKKYEAEIGFYAPNRPYFRVLYSNAIETPRRTPSPHPASDARWSLSANKFAEVLDVSGFTRDAVDVAIAGDNVEAAAQATHLAFSSFVGGGDFSGHSAEDLRYALLSLAAGITLADLRRRVGEPIYAALSASTEAISTERSRATLKEHFNIDEAEWTEEEFGAAVHGASLLHFPKTLTPRKMTSTFSPRHEPFGSHSVG